MSAVIDRAKDHFAAAPSGHIDVPEWGDDGTPLRVHFRLLTVAQRRKVWRDPSGGLLDGAQAAVRAVLYHAQDASGKRMFDDMDEHALNHLVDSEVASRIGMAILGFKAGRPPKTADQIEEAKNV